MRVLLLLERLEIGGIGSGTVALASGLRDRGVDVCVAHLGMSQEQLLTQELQSRGLPVLTVQIGHLLDPRPTFRLAAYLRRQGIDLLHTHSRYANLIGRPAAALAGRPVVSTVHNMGDMEAGWRGAVRRRLDDWSAQALCATVLTVCKAQRDWYGRVGGVAASRLAVCLNSVDIAAYRPDAAARVRARELLGIPTASPLFATTAKVRAGKGIPDLLEAAALVLRKAPRARFIVIGGGDHLAELVAQANTLGLGESIAFLGMRTDVAALLNAADVYVHPSHAEALPRSVLEAMATGLPVVASDVGGVGEVVAHERTGLLVSPGQPDLLATALERMLDPAARATMGCAGRAWVVQHASLDVWIDCHLRHYREAIGGREAADVTWVSARSSE